MKPAQKHPEELRRIQSLEALKILDTLPENHFNEIAMMAAQICETPVAFISFVDEERQWFKSKVGFKDKEVTREMSFCSHTILEDDFFVIQNALQDEKFSKIPFVTGALGIRFYAGVPLMSPDGMPVGTVAVADTYVRGLTEQQLKSLKALANQVSKLLELKIQTEKLKISQQAKSYKRTVIDSISEGIVLVDNNGKVVECNPAAAELLGLDTDTLIGRGTGDPCWKNISEDGFEFPKSELPTVKCLRTGQKQTHIVMGIYRSPEDLRWVSVNSVPLYLDGGDKPSHVVTSFTDITVFKNSESERRKLEGRLSDSARLSALGEMAGGMAHEINNPLAIILGKTSILKSKFENGELQLSNLKDFVKIEETVERIAKIIKGLRTHARNAEHDPFVVKNLSDIISETLDLCAQRLKNDGIKIEINCDPTLELECRSAQISQLIMNLINNSFDAIRELTDKWIKIEVSCENNDVKLTLTDSGSGIPDVLVGKIMQPFYSTKELGKGMGLGLSISKGIAETHGGTFEYQSKTRNTSFVLRLPQSQTAIKTKAA